MKHILILSLILLLTLFKSFSQENQYTDSLRQENERRIYQWFLDNQMDNGLLKTSESSKVSLYDNALAAMVFIVFKDYQRAEKIFDYFNQQLEKEFWVGKGGFTQIRNPDGSLYNTNKWMGDNAWLLIALNNYHQQKQLNKYQILSKEIENWLIHLQDSSGALIAGYNNNYPKEIFVTEGMLDAFIAVPGYTNFHQNILKFLMQNRWDPKVKSLTTGWDKYPIALDIQTWSYCGIKDFPDYTLYDAERFLITKRDYTNQVMVTGYCFDGDKDNIWYEGIAQMVVDLI